MTATRKYNDCYVYSGPTYGHLHRILMEKETTFTVETLDGATKFTVPKCDVEMPFICDQCHRGYYITTFGVDGLCPDCTAKQQVPKPIQEAA